MHRTNLTQFDEYPEAMLIYMKNYGPHFNKKLCKFATDNMTRKVNGIEQPIQPYTKPEVENLLNLYQVEVKRGQLYDKVYVANMCKADFLGSSVIDDKHLALYVKDVIDDIDAPDGLVFNRWYADCCYNGIAVDWEEML